MNDDTNANESAVVDDNSVKTLEAAKEELLLEAPDISSSAIVPEPIVIKEKMSANSVIAIILLIVAILLMIFVAVNVFVPGREFVQTSNANPNTVTETDKTSIDTDTNNDIIPSETTPTTDSRNGEVLVPSDFRWGQISMGEDSACGIKYDGITFCWGVGAYRGLDGATENNIVQVYNDGALGGRSIKTIAAGYSERCFIADDGGLYCIGDGRLWEKAGWGDLSVNTKLVHIDGGGVLKDKSVSSLTSNYHGVCALTDGDIIYCWGHDGFNNAYFGPINVSDNALLKGKKIVSMSSMNDHTCVIASDNKVYCWYNDQYGTLQGQRQDDMSPVAVDLGNSLIGETLTQISSGSTSDCVSTLSGRIYCWGYNNFGTLGDKTNINKLNPVLVYSNDALIGKKVASLVSGDLHFCALMTDGGIYCWGRNNEGQLGEGSVNNSNVPVAVNMDGVLSGKTVKNIYSYYNTVYALTTDGQLFGWGSNSSKLLSSSDTDYYNEPMIVFGQ